MAVPRFAVITTCKGRLSHLQQTLPGWLAVSCNVPWELWVVDYDCPQGTFGWVSTLAPPRRVHLRALRLRQALPLFCKSHAINLAACQTQAEVIVQLDADLQIREPAWLWNFVSPVVQGRKQLRFVDWRRDRSVTQQGYGSGMLAVATRLFHRVRGYDERLLGWGYEDTDFGQRAAAAIPKAATGFMRRTGIRLISHGDDQRLAFSASRTREEALGRNRRLCELRVGPVNPDGYGNGDCDYWCSSGR